MNLESKETPKYKGLANIGATCYMNSLLQTFYMTPEFRNAIYKWKYNSQIHGKQEDSILYQLQVLFTKLQSDFPKEVEPRGLIRSFQWGGQQAFEQQDIQQFNRVLFQAIQQSLKMSEQGIKQHELLAEMFEGIMMNYTKCKQCNQEYPRQQTFQDLILTVKDKFEKVYNKTLQIGLQRYLKPEILSGSNQYFCESCNQKRDAQRGVRLIKIPKFLPIILRRFSFDLMTMERIKLNDQVSFPFIINMNDYMNAYEDIPNKQVQQLFEQQFVVPQVKKPMIIKRNFLKASKKQVKLPNNIKNKPLAQTKSFLSDMRKKTGKNRQITIQIESGNRMLPSDVLQQQLMQAAINQSLLVNPQSVELKQNIHIQTQQTKQQQTTQCFNLPDPSDLPLPSLPSAKSNNSQQLPVGSPPPPLPQPEKQPKKQQSIDQKKQFQTALLEHEKINTQLKQKYLKAGPLVYELYSILVHQGGVNHGHYYAYIKSFQDGKWYGFNDFIVKQFNIKKISEQTFGGQASTRNAYVLYYRLVQQQNTPCIIVDPPVDIVQVINKQKQTFVSKQVERKRDAQKYIKLKIYYQLFTKPLQIINSSTLKQCLQAAQDLFGKQQFKDIKQSNIRLRMYNPLTDTKLDTYNGQENLTLDELKINSHKNMLIQVKKDDQTFDQYSVGAASVRISWWTEDISSLDQSVLKTTKVSFPFNSTMKQIQTKIKQVSGTTDPICIIKRHQNDEYSYHQIVNTEAHLEKTIQDLMIFQNEILFIEPESQNLKWPLSFESQAYKINVRYIIPKDKQTSDNSTLNITIDSRIKLLQLKQEICSKHNLDIQQTIFKRGNKSGSQLKDLEQTLQNYRFISGTQIFIENGIPSLVDQMRIVLYLSKPTALDTLNAYHTFDEIAEIPINPNNKASQCKQIFLKVLQKKRGIKLDSSKVRIRQRLTERMTKIYRQKPMKQQQVIEKRMIALEQLQSNQQISMKQNSVYIRVFDPSQWTLSDRFELKVNKIATMHQMSQMISSKYPSILPQNIEVTKIVALHKLSMLDLAQMDYWNMHKIQIPVSIQPMFIVNDGIIFIIKDKTKKLRELTKQERVKFGGNFKTTKSKPSTYKPPQRKQQRGVKITVKRFQNQIKESIKIQQSKQSSVKQIPQQNPLSTEQKIPQKQVTKKCQ